VRGTYKLERKEVRTGQNIERQKDNKGHSLTREGGSGLVRTWKESELA